ncbi:MAG: DUF4345 family protein [Archangium sp.]
MYSSAWVAAFTCQVIARVTCAAYFSTRCSTPSRRNAMQKLTVPYLVMIASLFAVVGLAVLVEPTFVARQLEMTVESPSAVSDFRAVYGGLCFAVATLGVLAVRREALRANTVLFFVLVLDGLVFGRIISLITHGPGSWLINAQFALEVFGTVAGALVMRASSPRALVHA